MRLLLVPALFGFALALGCGANAPAPFEREDVADLDDGDLDAPRPVTQVTKTAPIPIVTSPGPIEISVVEVLEEKEPVLQWLPPLVGRVTSPFGARDDGDWHDAIDIASGVGGEVIAPADLRINYIGYKTRAGRFIIADVLREDGTTKGDGFRLTFAHMSHVAVNEGQRIGRGELLGLTGVSGVVTGPHLHFRIEKVIDGARTAIDPLTMFTEAAITGVSAAK